MRRLRALLFHRRGLTARRHGGPYRPGEKTLTAPAPTFLSSPPFGLREEPETDHVQTLADREEDMVFALHDRALYMQPDLVVLALPLGDPQTVNWFARGT